MIKFKNRAKKYPYIEVSVNKYRDYCFSLPWDHQLKNFKYLPDKDFLPTVALWAGQARSQYPGGPFYVDFRWEHPGIPTRTSKNSSWSTTRLVACWWVVYAHYHAPASRTKVGRL